MGTSWPPLPSSGSHTRNSWLLRGPALVRLARGLLKDPYLAEDVVQDVLARALLQWSRVSAAHDVDAYVRRMVVNACTTWFRRAARRERVTDQALVLDRPAADRTDQFVERDQLVTLLRQLPAKQRAVLVLRHYEGLPDSDIARMLGSSEVTVRSNAHRGLARLRELIAEADAVARTGEIKLRHAGAGRRRPRP